MVAGTARVDGAHVNRCTYVRGTTMGKMWYAVWEYAYRYDLVGDGMYSGKRVKRGGKG